jgi:hypothetical protein
MKYPAGIVPPKHNYHYSQDSIFICHHGDVERGLKHDNTFDVKPEHMTLSGKTIGVRFNTETVPEALSQHKKKPTINRRKYLKGLGASDNRLEAASHHHSKNDDRKLISSGPGNGFFVACLTAFAQHLPLELSSDHFWTLITFAFAKHVDKHSEELRSKFVAHEGKKKLEVRTPDWFRMSNFFDPDTGASDKEWETFVFPEFSKQIKNHIGNDAHSLLTGSFSTSTAASTAASEITLMAAMKNYFSYKMSTLCGIPNITLTGTEEDWVALRNRTEALGKLMKEDFASYWMPLVLPILDEFVESYRGNVNHGFWQSMVKLRNNGMSSGHKEFISGWIQIFFPYLASGELNNKLHPWQDMYFHGPEPEDFPSIISSAPVTWDYHNKEFELYFHAGFTGVSQRSDDGMLIPEIGWYVSHQPSGGEHKSDGM